MRRGSVGERVEGQGLTFFSFERSFYPAWEQTLMSRTHHWRCQLPLSNTSAHIFSLSLCLSVFCDGIARLQVRPWSPLRSSYLPLDVTGPKFNHRVLVRTRQWGTQWERRRVRCGGWMEGWRVTASLITGFFLSPPVRIGDKSQPHTNLMKRLGEGAGARAHRLKTVCEVWGGTGYAWHPRQSL